MFVCAFTGVESGAFWRIKWKKCLTFYAAREDVVESFATRFALQRQEEDPDGAFAASAAKRSSFDSSSSSSSEGNDSDLEGRRQPKNCLLYTSPSPRDRG